MATKNAAILGEEMERCMQELNTLRAEGLEAELLGPRYRGKKKDPMPLEIKGTGYRKGKTEPEDPDDDVDEEGYGAWSEASSRSRLAKPNRGRAAPGRKEDYKVSDQISKMQRMAVDQFEEEGEDDDEEEEEEDKDTDEPQRVNMWDIVAKFFNVKTIQSPEHVRELVLNAMSSGGSLVGKIDDGVLKIFHDLTEQVLSKALPVVRDLRREPMKKNMRRYGFAMIIVNEYLKLAGLHAHVHRDMETFVDFYDKTSLVDARGAGGEKYLRFSKCCESVASEDDGTHAMSCKMTLRSISLDIARKMMLMATHLVELIVVLGWYEGK